MTDKVQDLVAAIESRNDSNFFMLRCVSKACRSAALEDKLVCEKHDVDGTIVTNTLLDLLDSWSDVLDKERVQVPRELVNRARDVKKNEKVRKESEESSEEVPKKKKSDKKKKDRAPLCKGKTKKGDKCTKPTTSKSGFCHLHE